MKTMLMFAGQGAQYQGMGLDLIQTFPYLESFISKASDILDIDMKDVFMREDSFNQTYETQLMMVITQAMMLDVLKQNHMTYDGVMGFSLGEMTALYAAGAYDYQTLITLTATRAKCMQQACHTTDGMMAAVVKLDSNTIESICQAHYQDDAYMIPVNYNAPLQTVISGHKKAYQNISEALKLAGGRVIPLNVAGAFHTNLMLNELKSYETLLQNTLFQTIEKNFISNVTGLTISDQLGTWMLKQVTSPVKFTTMLQTSQSLRYTRYIEIGPGEVLTGLIKRQIEDITVLTIKDAKGLEEFI